ncbi:MAG: 4-hydroxy-tetrahydrodipicolinate reductase [Proteobacteria bacterium]|nr:4-hydroxy-tetrahydrodipicolinate reductase [Pseudomonadota bacterium]
MVKIAVTGAAGRMGGRIISIISETEGVELAGALEHEGNAAIGKDAGELAGIGKLGVKVSSDAEAVMNAVDVLIDFTFPEVTLSIMKVVAGLGKAAVIGSTGFTESERSELEQMSAGIPVVFAPNMSMGVNVLFKLVSEAARALGDDFDIEMVETHHRMKKDAPSGTAMKLAELAAEAVGRKIADVGVYERHGMIGARSSDEIGVQTLRGGDVVGDHTVYFYGMGERVELTHRATSRDTFASGSVKAALWLKGKGPGLYNMQDVLGLK